MFKKTINEKIDLTVLFFKEKLHSRILAKNTIDPTAGGCVGLCRFFLPMGVKDHGHIIGSERFPVGGGKAGFVQPLRNLLSGQPLSAARLWS